MHIKKQFAAVPQVAHKGRFKGKSTDGEDPIIYMSSNQLESTKAGIKRAEGILKVKEVPHYVCGINTGFSCDPLSPQVRAFLKEEVAKDHEKLEQYEAGKKEHPEAYAQREVAEKEGNKLGAKANKCFRKALGHLSVAGGQALFQSSIIGLQHSGTLPALTGMVATLADGFVAANSMRKGLQLCEQKNEIDQKAKEAFNQQVQADKVQAKLMMKPELSAEEKEVSKETLNVLTDRVKSINQDLKNLTIESIKNKKDTNVEKINKEAQSFVENSLRVADSAFFQFNNFANRKLPYPLNGAWIGAFMASKDGAKAVQSAVEMAKENFPKDHPVMVNLGEAVANSGDAVGKLLFHTFIIPPECLPLEARGGMGLAQATAPILAMSDNIYNVLFNKDKEDADETSDEKKEVIRELKKNAIAVMANALFQTSNFGPVWGSATGALMAGQQAAKAVEKAELIAKPEKSSVEKAAEGKKIDAMGDAAKALGLLCFFNGVLGVKCKLDPRIALATGILNAVPEVMVSVKEMKESEQLSKQLSVQA